MEDEVSLKIVVKLGDKAAKKLPVASFGQFVVKYINWITRVRTMESGSDVEGWDIQKKLLNPATIGIKQ